jgi:hypothetical protein
MFADPLALRLEPAPSRPGRRSAWRSYAAIEVRYTRRLRRRFPQEGGHHQETDLRTEMFGVASNCEECFRTARVVNTSPLRQRLPSSWSPSP